MFNRLKAKRWWKKFFENASRTERRKVMRQARKIHKRKHKVWRGMDVEAGGLLLGKYYARHNKVTYDRDELVFVNLRNAAKSSEKVSGLISEKGKEQNNVVDLKKYMVLEYKLPGRVYTILKLLIFHYKDLSAGKTVIGSWHSHPVGIQEPSEQDEKQAKEHKERLGLVYYFLGIEKDGNVKFWRY